MFATCLRISWGGAGLVGQVQGPANAEVLFDKAGAIFMIKLRKIHSRNKTERGRPSRDGTLCCRRERLLPVPGYCPGNGKINKGNTIKRNNKTALDMSDTC